MDSRKWSRLSSFSFSLSFSMSPNPYHVWDSATSEFCLNVPSYIRKSEFGLFRQDAVWWWSLLYPASRSSLCLTAAEIQIQTIVVLKEEEEGRQWRCLSWSSVVLWGYRRFSEVVSALSVEWHCHVQEVWLSMTRVSEPSGSHSPDPLTSLPRLPVCRVASARWRWSSAATPRLARLFFPAGG